MEVFYDCASSSDIGLAGHADDLVTAFFAEGQFSKFSGHDSSLELESFRIEVDPAYVEVVPVYPSIFIKVPVG